MSLLRFLRRGPVPPSCERLSAVDSRIALAALMVRIARSDHDYSAVEKLQIERVLQESYDLSGSQARAMRTEAEHVEARATDTVRFTRILKDAVPIEDRVKLLESLWSLVLADDNRDYREDSYMRLIADLLYVTGRDSAFARQRASARIKAENSAAD